MASQAVTLMIPIDPSWDGGTRINIVTDRGTGTIDEETMLLQMPIEAVPGGREQGYGRDPYALRRHDGKPAVRRHGHGSEIYGVDTYGAYEPRIAVTVHVPAVFETWQFAAVAVDEAGNVQGDAVSELSVILSGTEPDPLQLFSFDEYDAVNDVVTFEWA